MNMSDNEQKERIGISIDSVTLTKVDAQLKKSGVKSRSEYINIAVDAYLDFLNNETIRNVVAPMFETVVSAKIEDSENRIARIIFKLAVELSMLMHITAVNGNISEVKMKELRRLCTEEVSRLGGQISFENAYRFQNE